MTTQEAACLVNEERHAFLQSLERHLGEGLWMP